MPKKKVVYNHENLFDKDPFPDYVVTNDPFERTISKVNRRNKKLDEKSALLDVEYTKVVKNDKEIYRYPMREASLDQYRREELKSADDKNKRFKSFVKLFKKRISGLRQKKKTMSMTIDAKIVHSLRGVGETVTDHTYGPFTVKMPINLCKYSRYIQVRFIHLDKLKHYPFIRLIYYRYWFRISQFG